MVTMTASQARAALPEILDRVLAGEEITITRHGTAVAVVVRPDVLGVRRAGRALTDASRIGDMIDRGQSIRLDEAPTLESERAGELLEELRASRTAR